MKEVILTLVLVFVCMAAGLVIMALLVLLSKKVQPYVLRLAEWLDCRKNSVLHVTGCALRGIANMMAK
jgi:uncharacterized membrane protein YcfT